MWHEWETRGTCIGFGRKARRKETTRKTETWWIDNIKMDLLETELLWTGLVWLRIGTGVELL
jgi:hypothetical protein